MPSPLVGEAHSAALATARVTTDVPRYRLAYLLTAILVANGLRCCGGNGWAFVDEAASLAFESRQAAGGHGADFDG